MEHKNHNSEHTSENMPSAGSEEVSIPDLWLAICRQKTLLGAIFTVGTLASLAIAMAIPRYYTASVVVMPPAQNTSASSAVLAQLGALANMPSFGGSKTGDEFYLAILRTRRLQAPLVKKLNLQSRYSTESMTETYAKLSERVSISSDRKAGLLYIEASDRDANFAADLANAHAVALSEVLDQIAVTEAQQRRMFFEQEL
ncbi:MAG TPA: Wzz/FepE/Etk N-terminal domain-containing protein, partial [Aquabacterium sp.]|uniref:Wzz/FepE/Etk N-terminal domain-containing protein n=1 Tax=Aquabacterium sp. TaxID=1872578 RepID=UPI002E30EC7E